MVDASHQFTIDGASPASVVRPSDIDEVAPILSQAAADGSAVAPVGGGGALTLGNPIERYDIALDMRGVDRILEHQAADLVLSVEAGATLSSISEALARHGQWLPIEAPNPRRATIGGLVATSLSGPGRLGHGSLRDYLIGISVVTPTGRLAKAGGMVVKNVSGFDLMRLHHGALGTLGVIVSANFKVLPAPRGQATVLARVPDIDSAHAIVDLAESANQRPSAVVADLGDDGTVTVAVRFDGLTLQVSSTATDLARRAGAEAQPMAEDESRAWWRNATDGLAPDESDGIELRLGVRPSAVRDLSSAVVRHARTHDISLQSFQLWPGLGTIIVRLGSRSSDGGAVDSVVCLANQSGAVCRVMAASPSIKTGRDVWGEAPASIETMRRLKDQFDPNRVLNPGRYSGHI